MIPTIIIKNVTASGVSVPDLDGLFIPALDSVVASELFELYLIYESIDLVILVENGTLVIYDDNGSLTPSEALEYLTPYNLRTSVIHAGTLPEEVALVGASDGDILIYGYQYGYGYPAQWSNVNAFDYFSALGFTTTPLESTKAITIERPTNAEDITFFFTKGPLLITQLTAVIKGTPTPTNPSVTWTLRYDFDRDSTGVEVITGGTSTTNTTTGEKITMFNNQNIPGGAFLWVETTDKQANVSELSITMNVLEQ